MIARSDLAAGVTMALMGIGVVACGSSAPLPRTATRPTGSVVHAATPEKRSASARRTSLPGIGATQRLRTAGAMLSVRVTRVINPLARSGAALQPGDHAVGVVIQIQNHGPGVYDSSATGDVSIVPSSGSSTPVFAAHGVCQTPLRDFDNYITAGEIRHGCVAFSIQGNARVLAVRFSPHGRAAGRATWTATR